MVMAISKKQIALLHVAKAKLGLSDEDYRNCLINVTGKKSSAALSSKGFEALLGHFNRLGFKQMPNAGQALGERAGMASPNQVNYILKLWRQYVGREDEKALNRWLQKSFGISALRFVDSDTAGKAIVALRRMTQRKVKHG